MLYREETPQDYEPPYFRAGDPEKDRFVFTTHNKSEVPEKFSVGAVATPYHGYDERLVLDKKKTTLTRSLQSRRPN